jgi:hypothetical protein
MSFEVKTTPQGRNYVRSVSEGSIELADAQAFSAHFRPGGDYAGKAMLSIMIDGASYTVESRKALVNSGTDMPALAVVVTSAALRVMLNFMVKAAQVAGQPVPNLRTFSSEPEALSWLDAQLGA